MWSCGDALFSPRWKINIREIRSFQAVIHRALSVSLSVSLSASFPLVATNPRNRCSPVRFPSPSGELDSSNFAIFIRRPFFPPRQMAFLLLTCSILSSRFFGFFFFVAWSRVERGTSWLTWFRLKGFDWCIRRRRRFIISVYHRLVRVKRRLSRSSSLTDQYLHIHYRGLVLQLIIERGRWRGRNLLLIMHDGIF